MTVESERIELVTQELVARKLFVARIIRSVTENPLVLGAFQTVDRAEFVPPDFKNLAYEDKIIPLAGGSSISQPSLVAKMTDSLGLSGKERVLEIGTASGYGAAILACCASQVYTIEYNEELADQGRFKLASLGYDNVYVRCSDGALGWPEEAPFDAIIVTAGASDIPKALVEQLIEGGRIVVPVGDHPDYLQLIVAQKGRDGLAIEEVGLVCFHPLMSPEHGGWTSETLKALAEARRRWAMEGETPEERLLRLTALKKRVQQLLEERELARRAANIADSGSELTE